jgi:6-pyruvoyl-tetrahydropterin synthase
VLRAVLAELNFRNLDDDPAFSGRNTTTEFMARVIFDRVAARIDAGELGSHAPGSDRPDADAGHAARVARRLGGLRRHPARPQHLNPAAFRRLGRWRRRAPAAS